MFDPLIKGKTLVCIIFPFIFVVPVYSRHVAIMFIDVSTAATRIPK